MSPMAGFTPNNTPYKPLTAARDGSNFTYESLHNRVPHILTSVINDFYTTIQGCTDAAAIAEGKSLTGQLSKLKHEMVTNKQLTPLEEDGVGDIKTWNHWLGLYFPTATWYTAPFLTWETYMYRRIATIFKRSEYWKQYDFFGEKKEATFRASMAAVAKMCGRVDALIRDCQAEDHQTRMHYLAFVEVLHASLWGNQTDLSMFPDLLKTEEALEEMQARIISAGQTNSAKIVVDDTDRVWKEIVGPMRGGRIDIVLDNAGFELLQDVLLAHWLVSLGYASKIVFHAKRIPWYVSDVTVEDFHWLVRVAQTPTLLLGATKGMAEADEAALVTLGSQWAGFLANGTWELKDELFWTGPYGFRYLPSAEEGREVWNGELTRADLVIFKGDLNYRKLIYDLEWPVSTPFGDALGAMATDPRAPAILALRTAKCDTIVGVAPDRARALFAAQRDWLCTGQYGVIQLNAKEENVKRNVD
ncbi:Hairy/enhancer-of-split with YRPW motif protein 2 [Coemansia sp. RSA 2424]|nr:Hairy/enhancer-of-split with YRPW motif protein 2 [Coemansia sp. RSA 2424]